MHPEELTPRQAEVAADPESLADLAEAEFTALGRRARRVEGLRKSTGKEIYTDDIVLPGMLHGKILRSTEAHANILSIDTSRAEALDGVHAVITGADAPTPYGIIPWTRDEHALCVDKVRFIGDAVAAVAAVDEDTANAALELIDVEYEPLPIYLTPEEALSEAGAEKPIHAARKEGRNGNILKHVHLEFGEVDASMADADVTVEGEYFFHGTTHTPIEPHCAIGQLNQNGVLEVWSSTQVPHYLQRELARGSRTRCGQDPGRPARGRGCVRRQVRALRSRVLRRSPGHADGPARQDPVYARGGLLLPPRASPHADDVQAGCLA